jgi:uncharacterized protein YndB with AHSA1/START domain
MASDEKKFNYLQDSIILFYLRRTVIQQVSSSATCKPKSSMKRIPVDLEYIFKASPAILYKFLTTPACLVRWFCDGVDINADVYTFSWDGNEENAEVVDDIEEERLRFRWEGAPRFEYLEFRMYLSPVTEETVLEITDFANEKEISDLKKLWDAQIKKLRQETGG